MKTPSQVCSEPWPDWARKGERVRRRQKRGKQGSNVCQF